MDKTLSSELYQFDVDERGESKQMMSPTEKIVCCNNKKEDNILIQDLFFPIN